MNKARARLDYRSDRSPVRGGLAIARQELPGKRGQANGVPAGTAEQARPCEQKDEELFIRPWRDLVILFRSTRQFLPGYSQSRLAALPTVFKLVLRISQLCHASRLRATLFGLQLSRNGFKAPAVLKRSRGFSHASIFAFGRLMIFLCCGFHHDKHFVIVVHAGRRVHGDFA